MASEDGRKVEDGRVFETDVCIIGAGAAGITLALELAGTDIRVIVLESGGLDLEEETQTLAGGETIGHPYLPLRACRLRFFGGTTGHWANWSSPFETDDFEERPWIPYSGWPFQLADLESEYKKAYALCGLADLPFDPAVWSTPDAVPFTFASGDIENRVEQVGTPPMKFGLEYRSILRAENMLTLLYSNVTELELSPDSSRVARAQVATLGGNRFTVEARLFVLAAGGIENPRLLLVSRGSRPAGIGNDHDLVGRFFMEHLNRQIGRFLPSDPTLSIDFYRRRVLHGSRALGQIQLPIATRQREKLSGFRLVIDKAFTEEPSEGVASAVSIAASLRAGELPDDFSTHLWNVIADFDDVAAELYRRYRKTPLRGRAYRVTTRAEQEPNPDSRVTLSDQKDALGRPFAKLDWQLTDTDLAVLKKGEAMMAAEFARAGLGRLAFLELTEGDSDYIFGGCHHMGTTRIADDPKRGVVDRNCKVHGTANLYVAGSSVFPTSGHCNPTLNIVALAVRLAKHVKEVFA
jgi:choline dehydrogenase-like flavoprotein